MSDDDDRIISMIPAQGWFTVWPFDMSTAEADGAYFLSPLAGWGLRRNGDVVPIDVDGDGLAMVSDSHVSIVHETQLMPEARIAGLLLTISPEEVRERVRQHAITDRRIREGRKRDRTAALAWLLAQPGLEELRKAGPGRYITVYRGPKGDFRVETSWNFPGPRAGLGTWRADSTELERHNPD